MGTLTLQPQAEDLRDVPGSIDAIMPYIGTAELDVGTLGAVVAGDMQSTDPERPGVAVVETGDQVVVRFGSVANARNQRAIDAAAFALFVAESDDAGFSGRWSSSVELRRVTGHFCAVRTGE